MLQLGLPTRETPRVEWADFALRRSMALDSAFSGSGTEKALLGNFDQSPAPGHLGSQKRRAAAVDLPVPYNGYQVWEIGNGRFHHYAKCLS
jgi:hypothetical protein